MSPAATAPHWEELAQAAIAKRDATIPAEWRLSKSCYPLPLDSTTLLETSGLLDATELQIVQLSASKLAAAIAAQEYTAVQVTTAFCKAAAIAQQATNCLTMLFPSEALDCAQLLDDELERTGTTVGPLHGVPVSIKCHIDIQGHDSPSGFLGLVGKMVAESDAQIVSALRDAGAVFFCKTTNPQSIMHLETSCYLGATVCPFNRNLTSGGSSGGEGALIGMFGSPLGVGTDIGGSVRSPAASGGIFCFKPTVARLSLHGCQAPHFTKGFDGIMGTLGPMARDVDDLELFMRVAAGSEAWRIDPYVTVKKWTTPTPPSRPLRVGVLRDDGIVRPVAPIRRGLDHVVAKLEDSSHFEVVEYSPFAEDDAWDIISRLYWSHDGGQLTREYIADSGEPIEPLTQWIIDQARCNGKGLSGDELLKLYYRRDAFRAAMAAHWQRSGIDVLLSPVGPSPAPPLGTAKYWNYTSFWNLANYPAAVFPTGLFVRQDDAEDYVPRNASEEHVRANYDPAVSIGAPVTLQLVGYIGHDEETIAALKEVVQVVRA